MKLTPNKKPFRLSLGEKGEMIAWNFLLKQDYQILEKNYRCPIGEIDAIVKKGKRIVFVEIKTRSDVRFGTPEESVGLAKQKKLARLAQWYLKSRSLRDVPFSFAVVGIFWKGSGEPEIRMTQDAFWVEDGEN